MQTALPAGAHAPRAQYLGCASRRRRSLGTRHGAASSAPCTAAHAGARDKQEVYVDSIVAAVRQAARDAGFALLLRDKCEDAGAPSSLMLDDGTDALCDGTTGARLGRRVRVRDATEASAALQLAGSDAAVLVEPADGCWSVIPAENLVAAFAGSGTRLLVSASSADGALALLGALQRGVDAVVLATDDAAQVAALEAHLRQRHAGVCMQRATVTRVEPAGCAARPALLTVLRVHAPLFS